MKSYGVTIQIIVKPLQQYFTWYYLFFYVVLTFESVNEILWYDHSNDPPPVLQSHGTICFVFFSISQN